MKQHKQHQYLILSNEIVNIYCLDWLLCEILHWLITFFYQNREDIGTYCQKINNDHYLKDLSVKCIKCLCVMQQHA